MSNHLHMGVQSAGGGLFSQVLSPTPTLASTGLATWVNQNLSTASNVATGVALVSPDGGNVFALHGLVKAAPAAPFTLTALLGVVSNAQSWNGAGIGWYDGSAKAQIITLNNNNTGGGSGANTNHLEVDNWTSPTSISGSAATTNNNGFSNLMWLQIADDGTNVYFRYGIDGVTFITLYSVAKASGFLGASGYSNIGFFANPVWGPTSATLLSWAGA